MLRNTAHNFCYYDYSSCTDGQKKATFLPQQQEERKAVAVARPMPQNCRSHSANSQPSSLMTQQSSIPEAQPKNQRNDILPTKPIQAE